MVVGTSHKIHLYSLQLFPYTLAVKPPLVIIQCSKVHKYTGLNGGCILLPLTCTGPAGYCIPPWLRHHTYVTMVTSWIRQRYFCRAPTKIHQLHILFYMSHNKAITIFIRYMKIDISATMMTSPRDIISTSLIYLRL